MAEKYSYRHILKNYVNDIAALTPSPGGGSAASFVCAVGIALIEMALRFSVKTRPGCITFLIKAKHAREKALRLVDLDAAVFSKARQARGPAKKRAYRELNKISFDLAGICITIMDAATPLRAQIKKSIMSDFHLGFNCVLLALDTAVKNAQENTLSHTSADKKKIRRLKTMCQKYAKKAGVRKEP